MIEWKTRPSQLRGENKVFELEETPQMHYYIKILSV